MRPYVRIVAHAVGLPSPALLCDYIRNSVGIGIAYLQSEGNAKAYKSGISK